MCVMDRLSIESSTVFVDFLVYIITMCIPRNHVCDAISISRNVLMSSSFKFGDQTYPPEGVVVVEVNEATNKNDYFYYIVRNPCMHIMISTGSLRSN